MSSPTLKSPSGAASASENTNLIVKSVCLQIALVRDEADASCAAPRLTLEEKAAIAERHARKQAESQKRGMAVMLRDIMAHKVIPPSAPCSWDSIWFRMSACECICQA